MQITLEDFHLATLGRAPTEVQVQLYNHPVGRGYSTSSPDELQTEACILKAVAQESHFKSVIFTPPARETWVLEHIGSVVDQAFERARVTRDVGLIQAYTQLFKRLLLNNNPLQMAQEPPCWVAIGFSTSDSLPEWLSQKLL